MDMTGKYLERFLSRIVRTDYCWEWDGAHFKSGYGETWNGKKPLLTHRVAYELWVGPIPTGHEIDHFACDNKGCLNPEHLRAVTPYENNMRSNSQAALNARKTHCVRGHEFTEENTYINARGARTCRACWKVWYVPKERKPLKTHCKRGHEFSDENTYRYLKNGKPARQCRECQVLARQKQKVGS